MNKVVDVSNLRCQEDRRILYILNDTGSYETFPLGWGDRFYFNDELMQVTKVQHQAKYLDAGATPYTVEVTVRKVV